MIVLGLKPAVDLELAEERANLTYFRDFCLNQQALEIDLLMIKKEGDQPIRNEIGRLFRKYNIIEYKSPKDELSIDTLYKVGAYTSLYKAYGDTVDERRADCIEYFTANFARGFREWGCFGTPIFADFYIILPENGCQCCGSRFAFLCLLQFICHLMLKARKSGH